MTQANLIEVPAHTGNPDSTERYTTRETLAWCLRVAGVEKFDLDVAACEEAHCAERYYTKEDDGLKRRWSGHVFLNPPFDNIPAWVARAWFAMEGEAKSVSMLLPANRTEQPFWQTSIEPVRDGRSRIGERIWLTTHFLPGRTKYGHPGNREAVGVGSPNFGSVLLVWKRSWTRKMQIIDVEEVTT